MFSQADKDTKPDVTAYHGFKQLQANMPARFNIQLFVKTVVWNNGVDKEKEFTSLSNAFKQLPVQEQTAIITGIKDKETQEETFQGIGSALLEAFPADMDWASRRQVILYLSYLERVGVANDDPVKFQKIVGETTKSISVQLKNGIKRLVEFREEFAPKARYDLVYLAIVDFEHLADRCSADFSNQNDFQEELFKAAAQSLLLMKLTGDGLDKNEVFGSNSEAWMKVAKKILKISDITDPVPLITDNSDDRLPKLTNFIAVTVCNTLGLTDLRVKDIEVIGKLCDMYLSNFGIRPDNGIEFGAH